jgi:(p)ppGpp synthase/HD superfamily hydrolase
VDWQKDDGGEDSGDFLRSIKEDLFDEEVFVFTPKGDVVGLRKGSTAVDFAYRIHSEVGNHCQGVRINDRLCPLATPLQNGDFVQIVTSKAAHPSLDWLNFVATPRRATASASGTRKATAMRTSSGARPCSNASWAATASMPCSTARLLPR